MSFLLMYGMEVGGGGGRQGGTKDHGMYNWQLIMAAPNMCMLSYEKAKLIYLLMKMAWHEKYVIWHGMPVMAVNLIISPSLSLSSCNSAHNNGALMKLLIIIIASRT